MKRKSRTINADSETFDLVRTQLEARLPELSEDAAKRIRDFVRQL